MSMGRCKVCTQLYTSNQNRPPTQNMTTTMLYSTPWGHQLSKKSLFLAQSAHHQSSIRGRFFFPTKIDSRNPWRGTFTDRPVGRLTRAMGTTKRNQRSSQAHVGLQILVSSGDVYVLSRKKKTHLFFNQDWRSEKYQISDKVPPRFLILSKMIHRFSCFSTHVCLFHDPLSPLLQLLPFTKLAELSPSLTPISTREDWFDVFVV